MNHLRETPSANADAKQKQRRHFLRQITATTAGLGFLGLTTSPVFSSAFQDCAPPPPPSTAIPFQPDTTISIRSRKVASELLPAEKEKLRAAYQALRELTVNNPKDPRGWMHQAAVHCWYCGGGAGEEIHGCWWFLPWHRCYLYFHERILGKLIGDPTLTLPYWDWDNPTHTLVPSAYIEPANISNPLFDETRGVTPSSVIPDEYVGSDIMTRVMSPTSYPRFIGTDADNPFPRGGILENAPHGAVHLWVTSPEDLSIAKPNMGVLETASRDPLFFAHHANIDRLWDVWLNADSRHKNPTADKWLNHRWTFYDENQQWTSISVADVIDMEKNLRYRYDATVNKPVEVVSPSPQRIEVTTEPVTRKVQIPTELRAKLSKPAAVPSTQTSPTYVIHIEDIDVPHDRSAFVRVYANLPTASAATSVKNENYIGYFAIVAKTKKAGGHRHRPLHIALEVTPKVRELIQTGQEVSVTLVPVSRGNQKPSNFRLSFKRVYIAEEDN